ncbi:YolD-like family protein [Anaerobacillus sp. MEB173]|uniref:YolD-like family protein n=1 Tax=Anaerobacillus sp. MEB173 TaxID=3383345 RepID=UPI003F90ABFD
MIRDRGNIKWTAMMLPEHVEMLKTLEEKTVYKTKPIVDEQQLTEMNETLCEAMAENQSLYFTYFQHHNYHVLVGKVHDFDQVNEKLRIKDYFEHVHILDIKNVIDIRIDND